MIPSSTAAGRHDRGAAAEAARARADVAETVELLAERMTPSRVLRSLFGRGCRCRRGRDVGDDDPVPGAARGRMGRRSRGHRLRLRHRATHGRAARYGGRNKAGRGRRTPALKPGRTEPAIRTGLNDVVDVLLDQHREIIAAFDRVRDTAAGQDRLEAFAALVQLLRHHERVEQRVVHPELAAFTDEVSRARVEEENAADRMLASLISLGVEDQASEAGLALAAADGGDDAEHEETEEFPVLRERIPAARRRQLAGEVFRQPVTRRAVRTRRREVTGGLSATPTECPPLGSRRTWPARSPHLFTDGAAAGPGRGADQGPWSRRRCRPGHWARPACDPAADGAVGASPPTQTVLRLQNSRMPCADSSRPYPEFFTPPKGSSG